MTQIALREKFIQFVQLINPAEAKNFEKDVGFCFGLSICHAAMNHIGKLAWWEAALLHIVHWNGKKNTLNKKINLPGATKPQTLREILTRVINYVKYHQEGVEHPTSEHLFDHQRAMLQPGTSNFEILTPKNKLLTIKKREIVAGLFESTELMALLEKEDIQNRICILTNMEHAITVEYNHPYWFLYDPNFEHVLPLGKAIYKKFHSKKKLVEEISEILGDMISIELASFENKPSKIKKVYEAHIKTKPEIVLCALPLMATDGPEYISEALNKSLMMFGKNIVENLLANMLMTIFHTEDNWNGLHYLVRYSPEQMHSILKHAMNAPNGKEKILIALNQKTSNGITGLKMIEHYAPACMDEIKLLLKNKSLLKHSIFMRRDQNKTPLQKDLIFVEKEKKWMR